MKLGEEQAFQKGATVASGTVEVAYLQGSHAVCFVGLRHFGTFVVRTVRIRSMQCFVPRSEWFQVPKVGLDAVLAEADADVQESPQV